MAYYEKVTIARCSQCGYEAPVGAVGEKCQAQIVTTRLSVKGVRVFPYCTTKSGIPSKLRKRVGYHCSVCPAFIPYLNVAVDHILFGPCRDKTRNKK